MSVYVVRVCGVFVCVELRGERNCQRSLGRAGVVGHRGSPCWVRLRSQTEKLVFAEGLPPADVTFIFFQSQLERKCSTLRIFHVFIRNIFSESWKVNMQSHGRTRTLCLHTARRARIYELLFEDIRQFEGLQIE